MKRGIHMLIKEDLQKTYSERYSHLPEEQIDRMVTNQIDSLYGNEEGYEQKLKESKESESSQHKPKFDDAAYQEMQNDFEEEDNSIKNPEALDVYETYKAHAINSGVPEGQAEAQARYAAFLEFGESAFKEPSADPLDREIARLTDRGLELTEHEKRLIKSTMRTQGISVIEAMRKVSLEQQKSQFNLEQDIKAAGGREAEYYDALALSDKRVLQGLKGSQPEAKWTARKYYKMFNDKSLPRKATAPKEETVSYAEYEAERKKIKEILGKLAEFN